MVELKLIIPTLARPDRLASLERSIQSAVDFAGSSSTVCVVVDGSAALPELERRFQGHSDRVRFLRTGARVGKGAACNFAFSASPNAKWIAVLDDDDVLSAGFPVMMQHARTAPERCQVFFADCIESEGVPWRPEPVIHWHSPGGYDPIRLLQENYIRQPCLVCRAGAWHSVNGYDQELLIGEDWDFFRRLSLEFDFVHVPVPVATVFTALCRDSRSSSLRSSPAEYHRQLQRIFRKTLSPRALVKLVVLRLTEGAFLDHNLALASRVRVPHVLQVPAGHRSHASGFEPWCIRLASQDEPTPDDWLDCKDAHPVEWPGARRASLDDFLALTGICRSSRTVDFAA